MDDLKSEAGKLKEPAIVAGVAVGTCFLVKKLTGISLGIDCHNFSGAGKAFALVTLSGRTVNWYNKRV